MGVIGLTSFMRDNDDVFIKSYRLRDTKVVVDAPNLINRLYSGTTVTDRHDLYGGDMVKFASFTRKFINLFKRAAVDLIFVFDGASDPGVNSKAPLKLRRAKTRFRSAMVSSVRGYGTAQLAPATAVVFRSVVQDEECQVIQCFYEADLEAVRIAKESGYPLLSNDSDFYLHDLPGGVISPDSLNYRPRRDSEGTYFVECDLYRIERFVSFFPHLQIECLPFLGILSGNDNVSKMKFQKFVTQLPRRWEEMQFEVTIRGLDRLIGENHYRIVKILYFLCGRSYDQVIDGICSSYSIPERPEIKSLLLDSLKAYKVPEKDIFFSECSKLYTDAYLKNYCRDPGELTRQVFADMIVRSIRWIKNAMEQDVLTQIILQIITRTAITIRTVPEDFRLSSSRQSLYQFIRVASTFVRFDKDDQRPCIVYDRVGNDYKPIEIYPLKELPRFGYIRHHMFDLPLQKESIRRHVLFASFSTSEDAYCARLTDALRWFDQPEAEDHTKIQLLFDYVDREFPESPLWSDFKMAVNMCFSYYIWYRKTSPKFSQGVGKSSFYNALSQSINRYKLDKAPDARRGAYYDISVVHQINQFQTCIVSFNLLNSLMGCTIPRLRLENWFNSVLLYNLTTKLRTK